MENHKIIATLGFLASLLCGACQSPCMPCIRSVRVQLLCLCPYLTERLRQEGQRTLFFFFLSLCQQTLGGLTKDDMIGTFRGTMLYRIVFSCSAHH